MHFRSAKRVDFVVKGGGVILRRIWSSLGFFYTDSQIDPSPFEESVRSWRAILRDEFFSSISFRFASSVRRSGVRRREIEANRGRKCTTA